VSLRALCITVLPLLLLVPATARAADEEIAELSRKVDVLTEEIERLRLGAAAETTRYESRSGLGPAASKVYGRSAGVSVGGYGEMLLEKLDREDESGSPAAGPRGRLDLLRAVFYFGYKFTDDLLFNSEIEFEHAGVFDEAAVEGEVTDPVEGTVAGEAELSGEVVVEFAYVEWQPRRRLGVRAGKLLVPLGLTNEIHEPPVFLGARRPEVERYIIPTTWAGNGVGLVGDLGAGVSYRAYVTEGLDAAHFTAADAIRGGRQGGSRSLVTHPAFAGRVDWAGTPGLLVGVSAYTGESWQRAQPEDAHLSARVTLLDFHGRMEWRGLEARGLYARGTLDEAADLSAALGVAGTPAALGKSFSGGYLEAGYDLLAQLRPGSRWALLPYGRYEAYDTQEDVPDGTENPAYDRRLVTAGLAVEPHPNVVLKVDRQWRHDGAESGRSQWNAAVGYLF
jgi:hypothetical protein